MVHVVTTRDHPENLAMRLRFPVRRDTLRKDAVAGLVLGVESVPDGLAAGLLAGVSPLSGLYAYLFGTIGGSLFTSSAFMAVQATGAMAIVVADVPAVHAADDPARALFTLSVLTGVVMLAAGFLRLGSVLRFVSNAVMVGFISAVGVNIILGQLANLTGYKAEGANRVVRAVNTLDPSRRAPPAVPGDRDRDDRADPPAGAHQGSARWGWCSRSSSPRLSWPSWDGAASPWSGISVRFPARCRCPRPRCCGWSLRWWSRRCHLRSWDWSRGRPFRPTSPTPTAATPTFPVTSSGRAPRT